MAAAAVPRATWVAFGLVALTAIGVTLATGALPPAVDWDHTFQPAVAALLRGDSPYAAAAFYNPPWALLPLIPFSGDPAAGRGALFVVAVCAFALIAYRLGATPVALGLFLLSPPVLHCLLNGNIEWLALLGLLLPPRWGLLLLAVKPQVAWAVGVWWAAEAWRERGWRGVVGMAWPTALALGVSVAVYGPWPLAARGALENWYNAALWPYSIPFGVAALAWGLWRHDVRGALLASPLLSPYALLHSWSGALLAGARRPGWLVAAVAALWALALRAALGGG